MPKSDLDAISDMLNSICKNYGAAFIAEVEESPSSPSKVLVFLRRTDGAKTEIPDQNLVKELEVPEYVDRVFVNIAQRE